jgi:hypothetical protein
MQFYLRRYVGSIGLCLLASLVSTQLFANDLDGYSNQVLQRQRALTALLSDLTDVHRGFRGTQHDLNCLQSLIDLTSLLRSDVVRVATVALISERMVNRTDEDMVNGVLAEVVPEQIRHFQAIRVFANESAGHCKSNALVATRTDQFSQIIQECISVFESMMRKLNAKEGTF